ncbi:MAG TPA: hypothetical protein VFE23_10625 [Usitatibacter sp.]|jgi:hypothetical protein|nr:hypothetical protein [Usitatibacter sp.]
MGKSNERDINVVNWTHRAFEYEDVQREVDKRVTIAEWLKKKNLTLTNAGAAVFANAAVGVVHMLEEALICITEPPGRDWSFIFRSSQLDETARQLCGEKQSLQRLEDGCNRAAATTHLANHPAVATEWEFLAGKPRLNKKKAARWNAVMNGAFHRFEAAGAIQYEVDTRDQKFQEERVYSWDFLETVSIYANAAK